MDAVRGSEPNRITIEICDDDRKQMHVLEFIQSILMRRWQLYICTCSCCFPLSTNFSLGSGCL